MNSCNKVMHPSIRLVTGVFSIVVMSLELFLSLPFTVVFVFIGVLATAVITAATGYSVNFLLVLVAEYLICLLVLSVLYVHDRLSNRLN